MSGTGPDDLGLALVDLMDDDAPDIGATIDAEVARVRLTLSHPAGARKFLDDGTWEWVKPPKSSSRNIRAILLEDPRWKGEIRLNRHTDTIEIDGTRLADEMVVGIKMAVADSYDFEPSVERVHGMVTHVAGLNGYHPPRDYLRSLKWDGTARLDGMLSVYAGAEDGELNRTIGRRFMISCVARAMQPGCKVDTVLILAGAQGIGKSTFFRALAGGDQWFRDTAIDMRNKDAFLALKGAWIYEMAELASMRPRDAETVKQFLSAMVDSYRKPYGRTMVQEPRQCVFVGTTNEASFLTDPTGSRRFWPVQVKGRPDVLRLTADRDQLWAEAVAAYEGHERWYLETNEEEMLTEAHAAFEHEDPWEQVIGEWFDTAPPGGATVSDLLHQALSMDVDKQTKGHEMRLTKILTRLGLKKTRPRQLNGKRPTKWSR